MITFRDDEGNEWTLWSVNYDAMGDIPGKRDATPDDLARAGYEEPPTIRRMIEVLQALGYFVESLRHVHIKTISGAVTKVRERCSTYRRELRRMNAALRVANLVQREQAAKIVELLKAIDEARKG